MPVDGFQIRTLILTMLYRLCPTLIREGYVYIAETPLFEITYREKNADKTWFAYSEKEKADIVRQLEGKKFTVQRSKGLGENDPEMMWLTTMNPETRRLVRVLPDEAEARKYLHSADMQSSQPLPWKMLRRVSAVFLCTQPILYSK